VSQWFGENPETYPEYGGHPGLDFAAPSGTPVWSVYWAEVVYAGVNPSWPGRGQHVILDHGDLWTYYMHLSDVDVVPGQSVEPGQRIGWSGNTGWSTGPHLHLGVYDPIIDQFIDPAPLLGLGEWAQ